MEEVVTLGEAEGDGYVVATDRVVVDASGRYWVGQYRDMVKVFDSDGAFIRVVGRQGSGPMEFDGNPYPIRASGDGSVQIADPRNGRVTTVGADFEFVDEVQVPPLFDAIARVSDSVFVVNRSRRTQNGAGQLLHLVSASRTLTSFGRVEGEVESPMQLRRILTTVDDRIISAPPAKYEIEVWTSEGGRVGTVAGPPLPETPTSEDPEGTPPSRMAALSVDQSNRLWVLITEVREDWQERSVDVGEPGRP